MRISSRGNVSGGPLAWVVIIFFAVGVIAFVIGWPLAVANQHGGIQWWGYPLEAVWLFVLSLAYVLTRPGRVRKPRRTTPEPAHGPRNERMHASDRR